MFRNLLAYLSESNDIIDSFVYFDETGTLDFLLENYDLLHTIGKEQLLTEIERFLSKRVNK